MQNSHRGLPILLLIGLILLYGGWALNLPGTLDTTYGTGGVADVLPTGYRIWSAAVQPDGKILLGGEVVDQWFVARVDNAGLLDTSFGSQGILHLFGSSAGDCFRDVTTQPDGKILVAGRKILGRDKAYWTVVRLNGDGSLDGSFADEGVFELLLGKGGVATAVEIQNDGKIVVGGHVYTRAFCLAVVRLNGNGSLDSTFGSLVKKNKPDRTGYFIDQTDLNNKTGAVSATRGMMAIDADGRILLGGYHVIFSDCCVARYTSQGEVDKSFNGNGRVWVKAPPGIGADVIGWGVDSFGYGSACKVYVSGRLHINENNTGLSIDAFMASYNDDGSVNINFNNDGYLHLGGIGEPSHYGEQIVVQDDGKVLFGVQVDLTGGVFRVNPDGSLDNSFGTGGQSHMVPNMAVFALAVGDDAVYVAGPVLPYSEEHGGVAKFFR